MLKLTNHMKEILELPSMADAIEQSTANPFDGIVMFKSTLHYLIRYVIDKAWLKTIIHLLDCPFCREKLSLTEKDVAKMLYDLFRESLLWLEVKYQL
ncbi:MAG: hypothetical protein QXH51_06755 [Candidatus Bathyarchaeia archaeon]